MIDELWERELERRVNEQMDAAAGTEFIANKYGHIAKRTDLRGEPHGWRLPVAVRVEVRRKRAR